MFRVKLEPRFSETDSMSVIHHSVIPVYLEYARMKLFEECGLPYSHLRDRGIDLAVVEYNVKLSRPILFGKPVYIEVIPEEFSGVRLKLSYRVFSLQTLSAEAYTILATVKVLRTGDSVKLKPVNLLKEAPDIYQGIKDIVKLYSIKGRG